MKDVIRLFRSPAAQAEFEAAYDEVVRACPLAMEDVNVPTTYGDTHVLVAGAPSAPAVVLLPPGGAYAPMWIRNLPALTKKFRTYAIDIVGELNMSHPSRPIRHHDEFIDWMRQLLDGLGIRKANIIGNSNGGFFALLTALRLPERVDGVVLISPAATFMQMWAWWIRLLIPAHIIASTLRAEKLILRAYDWLWQGFPMEPSFEKLRRLSKLSGYRYRPSINSAVPRVFSDDELKSINARVLLLIGDHEVIYNAQRAMARATRLVRNLKAIVVPNANHSAQYTAPDFVNEKVIAFLSK